ncbi:hypothetical protein N1851_014036 [Merluccius polli]|uniref:Uncharacterized protein n=1 Tax=Merluccius polli TaxID=89951 RepID=A0AA47MU87_MERPO|nr:hypothetical protein N1851_014036 [Merluccius polli]
MNLMNYVTIYAALWTLFSWLVCGDQRGDNGAGGAPNRITYSREFLLSLQPSARNPDIFSPLLRGLDRDRLSRKIPLKRIRRKRGKRGGVQRRIRKVDFDVRRSLPPLPSILLSNVQSIRNKVDELEAYAKCKREFKETCLLALTETWLGEADRDDELSISGFGHPIRMDRNPTNKAKGGGVCFYVNERNCNTVVVRERICTTDLKLLSISLRPHYLPREFSQLFIFTHGPMLLQPRS